MIFDKDDTPEARREPARRLRVGVTGLVAVVLVIVLATVIATGVGRRAEHEAANASVAENRVFVEQAVNSARPSEPLADLGVAPRAQAEETAGSANPDVVQPVPAAAGAGAESASPADGLSQNGQGGAKPSP